MLVLIFGSTTNSLTATISAFLGGLALGSILAGKLADKLNNKSLIRGYSLLEFGVGISALITPLLFNQIKDLYLNLSDGTSVTLSLLLIKFLLTSLTILLPTTLMGATLPFLARFLQNQAKFPDVTLSSLYAVNTFGGVIGVLVTGFILIELFGLKTSLHLAVALNILVSLLAFLLPISNKTRKSDSISAIKKTPTLYLALFGFSLSGFISIGYQILWTRVLTPTVGTMIYAFSSILAFYLVGLALGSFLYPIYRRLIHSSSYAFGLLQLGIGLSALLPVLVVHKLTLEPLPELILRLFIPTLLLGLTFPTTISLINQPKSSGSIIGLSYAANTAGAILGGYIASFLLIPLVGSSQSIVLLSIFNFFLAFIFISISQKSSFKISTLLISSLLIISSTYLFTNKNNRLLPLEIDIPILESRLQGVPHDFQEDEIASVFAKSQSKHNQELLVIDGVATTHRVSLTKYMAHLPIFIHPNPKQVMIIAFGMGNTYRSSLKHGLTTHAVELVPSVPKMYRLFHDDDLLNHPQGKVIINDGRNYAFLTHQKYDIIIIDPPPPFNTAGSTVLHSKEYYQDLIKTLNPNGIVNQWIYSYASNQDDISMAIRTFLEAFPHVYAVQKKDAPGGIFMLGSLSPINISNLDNLLKNPIVYSDLQEIQDKEFISPNQQPLEVLGDKESLMNILKDYPLITDTNPRTEYYLLRQKFKPTPNLTGENLENFVNLLRSGYDK